MGMSRIRGPYVRFCERDEVNLIQFTSPYSIFASIVGSIMIGRIPKGTRTLIQKDGFGAVFVLQERLILLG